MQLNYKHYTEERNVRIPTEEQNIKSVILIYQEILKIIDLYVFYNIYS